MIKLLKNAYVYAPENLGKKDVLIVDEKICKIADKIEGYDNLEEVEVFDLEGKMLAPGYIDLHVHITGGGGEQGFASRVPESQLSKFTSNGITTVLGLLGTDGVTRSLENLVAKARALTEEGMTAYALTSAYGYPATTLMGSVEKDIMMIPPIVGVKVAVSDHRSSNPSGEDLIELATQARRGGMLSGNSGLVVMHMGNGKGKMDPIFYALDHSDVSPKNLLPTHCLRTKDLRKDAIEFIRRGGIVDCSAGNSAEGIKKNAEHILKMIKKHGITTNHMTLSSDAFGSLPKFDEQGNCIGLTYASPKSLHKTMRYLVMNGLAVEEALPLLTSTPAEVLGLTGKKGCIKEGADADLLVLTDEFAIESVFARGKTAVHNGKVLLKGRFE